MMRYERIPGAKRRTSFVITAAAVAWVTLSAPARSGDAAHAPNSAHAASPASVPPPAEVSAERITERLRKAPPPKPKGEARRVPRDQFERGLRQKLKSVLDARSVPALGAAYFSPYPIGFFVSTFAFAAWALAWVGSSVTRTVRT